MPAREARPPPPSGTSGALARLRARLRDGPPLLLDGALGTEIERHGGNAGLPLWSSHALLEDPARVGRIHAEYAAAGAELLIANTFRTQARSLAHGGVAGRAAELSALAVGLAREAAGPEGFVAGSMPPLEDCYRPDLAPADPALAREHEAHARNLLDAGADLLWLETHNNVREARAALAAARRAGGEAVVCFVCDAEARLLSGEPLAAALAAVAPLGPLAVGVNCLPADAVRACLPVLAAGDLPFVVYANLGAPAADGGFERTDALTPEAFAAEAAAWLAAGAAGVGGCCGTTPAHVAAIGKQLPNPGRARTQIASPRA